MKKFHIHVTEKSHVYYVIEAENADDAMTRFSEWIDDEENLQTVYYDMERSGYEGMDYIVERVDQDAEVDIPYKE